jgi:NADH-quinone oxidoreductase subunit N
LEKEDLPGEEYYALLMFATVGMMLMAMAGDMVMIFLGLEISSIATYVMAGYRRKDLRSNESALKYFILGSFSTAFLLYGMALIYGATGSTNLEAIRGIIKGGLNVASQQPVSTELLFIGVAMMLIGFGFKIAGVPFHLWAPDVYEGAPTPVAGFMAAGSKAAAFAAFLRVFSLTFSEAASFDLHATWVTTLQIIAVLTMTLGNAVAITQTNIKRMLAYSSIAHAGYVLVGFIAGDWGAVAFYMLAYSVMNIGAFTIISLFTGEGDKKLQLSDYAGWGFKSMGLSIALLIFMLSMAGVPATGGFIGKFLVFRAAWDKGFHLLVIIAVLNSAASVYYYLRPMVSLFFQEGKADDNPPRMPITIGFAVTLALIGTFYLGVAPGWLIRWLEVAKSVIN